MSRIGNKIIDIPQGVNITVNSDEISVKGPKGTLTTPLFNGITVDKQEKTIQVKRTDDGKDQKSKHGLVRSLLANSIDGAVNGYSKTLILEGVGYKANKKGNVLVLNLGLSHDVNFALPDDVKVEVPEVTKVVISGIDKQRVGQIAADIKKFRKPEPYKGKGIRYEGEVIRRKAGKAGKK